MSQFANNNGDNALVPGSRELRPYWRKPWLSIIRSSDNNSLMVPVKHHQADSRGEEPPRIFNVDDITVNLNGTTATHHRAMSEMRNSNVTLYHGAEYKNADKSTLSYLRNHDDRTAHSINTVHYQNVYRSPKRHEGFYMQPAIKVLLLFFFFCLSTFLFYKRQIFVCLIRRIDCKRTATTCEPDTSSETRQKSIFEKMVKGTFDGYIY